MIKWCLECDDKLLGNRRIFVFLAIEHLLGIRSDVEVHYQLHSIVTEVTRLLQGFKKCALLETRSGIKANHLVKTNQEVYMVLI